MPEIDRTVEVSRTVLDPATESRSIGSLSGASLLEMFRHWDTRVSHHETVYVALSLAPIGLTISVHDALKPGFVVAAAIASIATYVFFLFSVRRFGEFQDRLFHLLASREFEEWPYLTRHAGMGVRKVRFVGLGILGMLWALLLCTNLAVQKPLVELTVGWQALLTLLPLTSFLVAYWLWTDLDISKAESVSYRSDG